MKILRNDVTSEGVVIRLEDWSEDYSCYSYGSTIAAYPKRYARIRLEADFNSHEEALDIFDKLTSGEIGFFDVNFTIMESAQRIPFVSRVDRYKFNMVYSEKERENMKKYSKTFRFFDTEAEARSFCDSENRTGSAYKRNRYPAHFTPWTSSDATEHKYIAWYHA